MDETTTEPDQDFNRDGLRTLATMRRSSDDQIVAGVCGGVARHLHVDPIIIRIAVVALTFIGMSGLILYLAAWFLIPADDEAQSVAADWFHLERNEEQVRTIGLFVALVLAVAAVVGDNGWGFGWIGWWIIPAAFLFWLFVVRPRRRREWLASGAEPPPPYPAPAPGTSEAHVAEFTAWKTAQVLERKRARYERRHESRVFTGLALSVILIAEAVTLLVDQTIVDVPGPTYIAVALAVVAVGCLVGTFWGNASGLIGIGVLLTIALAISTLTAGGPIGSQEFTPQSAQSVKSTYRHGIGELQVDLSGINRTAGLVGRTVTVKAGVGRTAVYLPKDLPVTVDVQLRAGDVAVFGREWNGPDNHRKVIDGTGPGLHLVIDQRVGDVEVNRR
jgi:phage shock protein PspC (stress-responsive transcriptional regulator)